MLEVSWPLAWLSSVSDWCRAVTWSGAILLLAADSISSELSLLNSLRLPPRAKLLLWGCFGSSWLSSSLSTECFSTIWTGSLALENSSRILFQINSVSQWWAPLCVVSLCRLLLLGHCGLFSALIGRQRSRDLMKTSYWLTAESLCVCCSAQTLGTRVIQN